MRTDFPNCIEIYPEHLECCLLPKNLDPGLHWLFCQGYRQKVPSAFVTTLPEGRIFGLNGSIVSSCGRLLGDAVQMYQKPHAHLPVYSKASQAAFPYIDETVGVLVTPYSTNYYHWLFDVLARLHLLRSSNITCDRYLISVDNLPFQQETLTLLGISNKTIIVAHPGLQLQARCLLVPSIATSVPSLPSWACRFLQAELSSLRTYRKNCTRIYISRADATYRKVINEQQCISFLKQFGIQPVTLRNLSVSEQASIFSSADLIIAPHGAGLSNLIFCKPGTKVIELFAPGYVRHYYWWLAHHLQLDYYCSVGIGPESAWNVPSFGQKDDIQLPSEMMPYVQRFAAHHQRIALDARQDNHWAEIEKLPGSLLQSEAVVLQLLVKELPAFAHVIEVDSHHGRSTLALASALPDNSQLYPVSTRIDDPLPTSLHNTLAAYKLCHKVPTGAFTPSHFTDQSVAMLYINSGGNYSVIRDQLGRWYVKLQAGGKLVLRNYGWLPGVKKAVDSFGLKGSQIADSLWLHSKQE